MFTVFFLNVCVSVFVCGVMLGSMCSELVVCSALAYGQSIIFTTMLLTYTDKIIKVVILIYVSFDKMHSFRSYLL